MTKEFGPLTIEITKALSKNEKKKQGIFITPYSILSKLTERIFFFAGKNKKKIATILEPTCGTCEIISYVDKRNGEKGGGKLEIDGVEKNDTIYDSIKDLKFENKVSLFHKDFLLFQTSKRYDVVIGNPPFFVYQKSLVPKRFLPLFNGRPNMFCIILLLSIEKLNSRGILGFVLPKTFFHSSSYSLIRKYIIDTCDILDIMDFGQNDDYIDTAQETFGLLIQLKKTEEKEEKEEKEDSPFVYYVKQTSSYMFTTDSSILKKLFSHSTTLQNMGLFVKTGKVVWNQHKEKLAMEGIEGNNCVLYYNTNISNSNTIELKNDMSGGKKQYIEMKGMGWKKKEDKKEEEKEEEEEEEEKGEEEEEEEGDNEDEMKYYEGEGGGGGSIVLIVNRGNGNSKYKLKYALIDTSKPFLVENHLNIIYSKTLKGDELRNMFNIVVKSFQSLKTQEFIEHFVTNGSLSKTELETIFPIYL